MVDPRVQSEELIRDPHLSIGADHDLRLQLDAQRAQCPVMRGPDGTITLLAHADVRSAAVDADTFSSAVSSRRALPNSLDGAEHRAFRSLIDAYFTDEEVAAQEPQCRAHATGIIASLARNTTVSAMFDIGTPFAVRAQCTWLGWPEHIESELVQWMADNRAASRRGVPEELAEIAHRFDAIITRILQARGSETERFAADATGRLMRDTVDGRALEHDEMVSILRNWTSGDLGSLASSVGVIVHYLASDVALQSYLRSLITAGQPAAFEDAIEEILRIDDPFVSNRRITTRDTTIGGVRVEAGTRVHLNWTAANRDPEVFTEPDAFNPSQHQADNLVFGVGPHLCPGRALTLMELRVIVWELLEQTEQVSLASDTAPVRERPPVSGWARVPIVLDPRELR